MNHLEKRGNDTIRTMKKQLILDFDVECTIVQFHSDNHNSQFDRWIGLKFYLESPDRLSYLGLNFQIRVQEDITILVNRGCTNFVIYFILTCPTFSLFWEFSTSTKIFNGQQHSFQVWQWFINVSKSFSYKDSLFILATTRKDDFIINATFRSDFLVYLELLHGDKFDSSIFRIVIFGFLLFLFFSS
jgi:hypothetical protein